MAAADGHNGAQQHRTVHNPDIIVAEPSRLTVRVTSPIDYDNACVYVTNFFISKAVLTSKTDYFKASMRHDPSKTVIDLEDDTADSIHVWLAHLHELDEADIESRGLYDISIDEVWHVINAGDKYSFDAEILREWFRTWYEKNVAHKDLSQFVSPLKQELIGDYYDNEPESVSQLALPCYFFDHAEGFARITKWLAYNVDGHIKERKPFKFKWTHIHMAPPDFVGPMNHARGGLKTAVHRHTWTKVGNLLRRGDRTCRCWDSTSGQYFAALVKVGAYPLEEVFPRNSVNDILVFLGKFDHTSPNTQCSYCNIDWNSEVRGAVAIVGKYFDGLCLDCMDKSKPKRKDIDADYWKHCKSVDGRWDTNCRIRHGEPTWYVSWCGRDEHKQKLLKQHRKDNPKPRVFGSFGFY